jgi:ribosomal protein L20
MHAQFSFRELFSSGQKFSFRELYLHSRNAVLRAHKIQFSLIIVQYNNAEVLIRRRECSLPNFGLIISKIFEFVTP